MMVNFMKTWMVEQYQKRILKNLYPDIYKLVVIKFVKKVYNRDPNEIQKLIIDKYADDCNIFDKEIKIMVKTVNKKVNCLIFFIFKINDSIF